MKVLLRWIALSLASIACGLWAIWAVAALRYDFPVASDAVACGFVVALLSALLVVRGFWRKLGAISAGCTLVLVWWLSLKPTNQADWLPDVARLSWAEVEGDTVTLHNVRNCDYRTETDYTPNWEDRTIKLSQITGIDLAMIYWGSEWIAHPIISFQFADAPPICFSIETRKKTGQTYSSIGGLYRQFELIYVVADERDVIRLRSNYRRGEDVYLYRTLTTPSQARERFLEYVSSLNAMRVKPRWYNAVTTNCTTAIRQQHPAEERIAWDWRLLLNGKADELMFERGTIASNGLPFAELKRRALINQSAQAANDAADFSLRVREGRPGFSTP